MDDGTKCCLGIIVIFVIIALFLFWPSAPEAKDTYMELNVYDETSDGNDGYIQVSCYENGTDEENVTEVENATVLVNVTYENGTVVKYNLTTDVFGNAEIRNLSSGKYNVSAYMVGDDTHNPATYTENLEVVKYVEPVESESGSESEYDTDYETTYDTTQGYTYRYYWVYV